MLPPCTSAQRCCSLDCAACTWRYALGLTRRILACEPTRLHVVTIPGVAKSPHEFRRWRKAIHNVVAYRRRRSRWWRAVGLWGWWDGTGLHGLVELGSITATEFVSALRRLGEVSLRPLDSDNVRVEVYRAARSASAVSRIDVAGRYQSLKIAIEPVTVAVTMVPIVGSKMIEALPIIV